MKYKTPKEASRMTASEKNKFIASGGSFNTSSRMKEITKNWPKASSIKNKTLSSMKKMEIASGFKTNKEKQDYQHKFHRAWNE